MSYPINVADLVRLKKAYFGNHPSLPTDKDIGEATSAVHVGTKVDLERQLIKVWFPRIKTSYSFYSDELVKISK